MKTFATEKECFWVIRDATELDPEEVHPEQCECCGWWHWSSYYDGMIVGSNGEPHDRVCIDCDVMCNCKQ